MRTQEKLRKEEEALEAKLFSTPTADKAKSPEAATEVEKKDAAPDTKTAATDPSVTPSTPEATPKAREDGEDWKKRYTNLRASRDQKLYAAQQEVASMKEELLKLQQEVQDLRDAKPVPTKDIFEGIISDEDKEAIGDTALDAMRKTAEAAAEENRKAIEKELQDIREMKKRQAENEVRQAKQDAYDNFLMRLSKAVPDYQAVNVDPKFAEFMSELDIDGNSRADNFLAAESHGDVATVARYMIDFKKQKPAEKKNPLEDKITPEAKATSTPKTTDSKDNTLTWDQVNKHYQDFAKGLYRGRMADYEAMEKRIDEAAARGAIRRS